MTNDKASIQQEPFQVVLIDLQRVAQGKIHCVKKLLTDKLKYVAISYRWGELQETAVDTGVGYVASITSFDLHDFYELCIAMMYEPTMKSMDYVWVDAICVNQSDHDERKATIYHMSEIYEHAAWILAVPDLHAEHLRMMHSDVMGLIQQHQKYLYHLVHGHSNELFKMDEEFLDTICVSQDQTLRRLLTNHTHSFTKGFMTIQENHLHYDDDYILAHLYDIHSAMDLPQTILNTFHVDEIDDEIRTLHKCHDTHCPFTSICFASLYRHKEWHKNILKRSTAIRRAMHFLTDLVIDWSSRVWVISEFHISKKKNNLKFWFNQLAFYKENTFSRLDMNEWKAIQDTKVENYIKQTSDPVRLVFYQRLYLQLHRQTFLEMMLKSKASKHEDRFYAILPLFPEYKPLMQNKDLVTAHSLLAVKLKLYQIMTPQDKILLLYLSRRGTLTWTLPTFATALIHWQETDDFNHLTQSSLDVGYTLCHQQKANRHYLIMTPTRYRISQSARCADPAAARVLTRLLNKPFHPSNAIDVLMVGCATFEILLIGSFNENIWLVGNTAAFQLNNSYVDIIKVPDDFPGFYIY